MKRLAPTPSPIRVSVIMPIWNAERFLVEAVASVQSQTYRNWELLAVDDGSTDGSSALARSCTERDPARIRYLEHQGRANRGPSATRNLGIAHARGEYLAFLDADDVWLPHKLEQQVPILDAHPHVGMVNADTLWWYSWTGAPEDQDRDFVDSAGFPDGTVLPPPQMLTLWLAERIPAPWPGSVLLRRDTVEAVGGFEDDFRNAFEDQVFFSKICLHAPAYLARASWARYRRHRNSFSAVMNRADETDRAALSYLEWLRTYLDSRGISDPALRRALRIRTRRHRHPRIVKVAGRAKRWIRRVIRG